MRKTKIICTLGSATDPDDVFNKLFVNGMNVARMNFSHGTHEEHSERIKRFKAFRSTHGFPVALLMDLRGPKIRLKKFTNNAVTIREGQNFTLTTKDILGDETIAGVSYDGLVNEVKPGNTILIDDGLIALEVDHTTADEIHTKVITGGIVSNNKGLNVPDVSIKIPFLSDKDMLDIDFAVRNDFDVIAASFTRNAGDVNQLRNVLLSHNCDWIKIIAKIENREGVQNIDEIIRSSDGIMIARGDMGVEIPYEELPAIQKSIIKKCLLFGKPVITATQMLDSMIRNPRPTRAEITDVANAIYDGTSCLMLSGETSIGKYPLESLQIMSRIAEETERNIKYQEIFDSTIQSMNQNITNSISHATCGVAHTLGAAAIIAVTKSGHTARMVSKYRPSPMIIAPTTREKVFQQLSLSWGVVPLLAQTKNDTDSVLTHACDLAEKAGLIHHGQCVVITGGIHADISGSTNMLKVQIIGDVLVRGKGIGSTRRSGIVTIIQSDSDIDHFNQGDILVIKDSTEAILKLVKNATAVITEESAHESRAVIIAKALDIPIITEAEHANDILLNGAMVTVDPQAGLVYSGYK